MSSHLKPAWPTNIAEKNLIYRETQLSRYGGTILGTWALHPFPWLLNIIMEYYDIPFELKLRLDDTEHPPLA